MIKIVTDSTCDLPPEVLEQYGITVIPLSVQFGTETFLDGVTLNRDEFYQRLGTADQLPTTSQPSAGEFYEIFNPLLEAGHEIIAILVSSKLSGTCSSAYAACVLLPDAPITVIDSLSTSAGLGWMVWEAARMSESGADVAAVQARMVEMSGKMRLYFVVDTLEYLQKGGRIGGARALLGTMLRIKPILALQEGQVESFEQVRTRRKALQRLVDLIAEEMSEYSEVRAAALHAQAAEEVGGILERLQAVVSCKSSFVSEVGPAVGTHTGPRVIGIAAYGD